MTCKYNDKVWTVHGGNATALRNLNANYITYFNIIKDAHEEGYKKIDFFGCSGDANPDKSSSIYGLHNFKKRLGGEYHEFIGEFDLITNKLIYDMYHVYVIVRKKIKQLRK
jgi:lipid II:glycine glycyltransferase (peptidoglycan interpeptide bridge formation enzyme)